MQKEKNKMTGDTIPEGFTVPMALVDLLPVLFFGGTGVLLGMLLDNVFVEICSILVFLSGLVKVIWKMIAAVKKKNIWPLFVQMRIVMPAAFLAETAGIIVSLSGMDGATVAATLLGLPQIIFFITGIIGLAAMILCAVKLDSSDLKSNWVEQTINSVAQACIFLGLLMIYLA